MSENGKASNVVNFRSNRAREMKEFFEDIEIPYSTAFSAFTEFMMDNEELRKDLQESENKTSIERKIVDSLEYSPNKAGFNLSEDDYGKLIEASGEYLHSLEEGRLDEAMEYGEIIRDIDEDIGDLFAKCLVYSEEQGYL